MPNAGPKNIAVAKPIDDEYVEYRPPCAARAGVTRVRIYRTTASIVKAPIARMALVTEL